MQEDRTLRRNKMRSTEGPEAPPEARPLTHEHVVRGPRRDLSSAPALDAGSRHAPRARSSATRVASCNPARGAAALELQIAACTARTNGAFARCSSPVVCSASGDEQPLAAAAAVGLAANAVVFVSLYFVATTGGGLPAGPFGLLGAAEGVSYLVVVGIVGAALRSKLSTGAGLPSGPAGLLGAAEGLSFLSVLGGLAVLALLVAQQGCVPNALPIVDYSSLVRVCRGEPGLFGGVL